MWLMTLSSRIYLLTEYFCWVNNSLTNPQLEQDELRGKLSTNTLIRVSTLGYADRSVAERYPNCNLFIDTSV